MAGVIRDKNTSVGPYSNPFGCLERVLRHDDRDDLRRRDMMLNRPDLDEPDARDRGKRQAQCQNGLRATPAPGMLLPGARRPIENVPRLALRHGVCPPVNVPAQFLDVPHGVTFSPGAE